MSPYEIMGVAWLGVIIWVGIVIFTNRKTHPGALFLLFFAELWERFSYYGMRALLVLYMVDQIVLGDAADTMTGMGYSKEMAYAVYAAYGAMVYATPVLGGLLAEKVLGYRKSIIWGGVLMALGHFAMAIEDENVFFIALAMLILGNGFFKPNISSFVGKFYADGDPRRDGGFTIFYMGINIGAFLTPLTCGVIGQDPNYGWHYGFGLAGIGMVIGLIVFIIGLFMGVFKDEGYAPEPKIKGGSGKSVAATARGWIGPITTNEILVYVGSIAAIPLVYILLNHGDVLDYILGGVSIGGLVALLYMAFTQETTISRDKLLVIFVLFLFTALFWTFFELAGSAISLFTEENVDKTLFGEEQKTAMFQSVNPLFIIFLAPLFSFMWQGLAKVKMEPSTPLKFAIGVLLLGLGFVVLGISGGAATEGMVPVMYLILGYLLHTIGELCVSPVGLSLVTKLSPAKVVGFVMGIWFLSSSIAHQAGKFIANETASEGLSAVETLPLYTDVFMNVGYVALGASVVLFGLAPLLKKMMHGVR